MRHEIISPTHNLSKYEEKNWEFPSILKSYNEFCIGMFLPMYYGKDSAGPRVITGQKKVNKVSKCLTNSAKYDDRKKLAIPCCKMPVRVKTAQILKILKMS